MADDQKVSTPTVENTDTKAVEYPKRRGSAGLSNDPEARARQLKGLRPWRPGQSGNPSGRPKGPTFTETLRRVVDGDVPEFLVEKIRKRLKMPPDAIREMSIREVISAYLVLDYIEKGDHAALAAFLDRIDPKQRRVQHEGEIGHKVLAMVLKQDVSESEAADVYKSMLESGGTVDVTPPDDDGQPE